MNDFPHRRFNLLTGEWVLVSPHRTKRPWQGQRDEPDMDTGPEFDPGCYLCPGNERAGGARTPDYDGTYVFTNDFSALLPDMPGDAPLADTPDAPDDPDELLRAVPETGICRVVCYSPRHDLTLSRMDPEDVAGVVDTWAREYRDLGARDDISHVQIFENRGGQMGCSNPHPHGQIWANRTVPLIPAAEGLNQAAHMGRVGRCLLCDYLERELAEGQRVVFENRSFVVLVPYWAVWPFETMILPLEHSGSMTGMTPEQTRDLADALIRLGARYDNVFSTSFPWSMGIHQRPTDGGEHPHWHWHFHYYPPLLRSASVRKFMVGYEMLASPQRDVTPEYAAKVLREVSEIHYLDERGG